MQGKFPPGHNNDARMYVGIDVCKDWLDVHVHPSGLRFREANTLQGVRVIKKRLAKTPVGRVAMEATGKHHRLVWRTLHAAGMAVAVVNPLRVRLFAEGLGQLAKTDGLDARILALVAECGQYPASEPESQTVIGLQELLNARTAFIADMTALRNRRGDCKEAYLARMLDKRISELERHIEKLDAEIDARVKADEGLAHRYELLLSIPGVGRVVALTLVIALPELGEGKGKSMSTLVGVAPVLNASGSWIGASPIRGGRPNVRKALYQAALSASRYNPPLKATYDRLCKNGKKPKQALVAVMRKLVVIANALVAENRKWQPTCP
jgi:transposase